MLHQYIRLAVKIAVLVGQCFFSGVMTFISLIFGSPDKDFYWLFIIWLWLFLLIIWLKREKGPRVVVFLFYVYNMDIFKYVGEFSILELRGRKLIKYVGWLAGWNNNMEQSTGATT